MKLRRALLGCIAFALGAIGVYALALGLGFFGFSTLAGLPYEQLLGWMLAGGAGCTALTLLLARR